MKSIVKSLLALGLLLSLTLVTGCGKNANPMSPNVDPTPPAKEYIDVTVTLQYVYAVADGDGIEGAGEFEYEAIVYDGPNPLMVSGSPVLNDGESSHISQSKVMRVEKGAPYTIEVGFVATEWDWNIFGYKYADTRMDHLHDQRAHTTLGVDGFNDGDRTLLVGEGDLRLRLNYTITSKPVV